MKRSSVSISIAVFLVAALFAPTVAQLSASTKDARYVAQTFLDDQSINARATASPRGVLVEWTTPLDGQILGFNVFRFVRAQRVKLNPSLIAGPTLVFSGRSQSFAWFDPVGTTDSTYEVESVDLRGESLQKTIAVPGAAATTLPAYRQTPLLADVGKSQVNQTSNTVWANTEKIDRAAEVVAGDNSASLSQQWLLANQPALKIGIRSDGWYRITQPQLSAAGFDVTGDARNLQLFVEGNELAISVSREAGVLTQADFIEFWGQGLDSPTADTRVYWLVNGTQTGKRMGISGNLHPDTAQPGPSVISRPEPLIGSSQMQFNVTGFWRIPETASSLAINGKNNEKVAVTKEIYDAVSWPSAGSKIASGPANEGVSQSVPQPVLAKQPTPQPVPSAERNAVSSQSAFATVASARHNLSAKSRVRSRRKTPRNHRRRSRQRLHNHSLDVGTTVPAFASSIEYSPHNIYYTKALNGDHENFFGPVITGNGALVNLSTHNVERTSTAPVQLSVSLQGASLGTHQINVSVNGTPAGSISFSDESSTNQTLSFPGAWLIDGDNLIKLAPTSANDVSLVDYVRVTYPHSFRAENDSLQFSLKATQSARVDGFTTADIRIVDVTDPTSVQSVRPIIDGSGSAFAATVPSGERGKARRLVALPASRISQPASLTLNQRSALNSNTNGADLVIIAYKDFIPSLAPLVAQRQAGGYVVKLVDIDDVYDEFSFGAHTPQAIRDFMSLARSSWTRAPSYLLLAGDASYDPRNRLGAGNFDFVPTRLVDTGTAGTATALETASDDWLTDFDGNGIADIAVGRLPVRSVAEANLVVSKIVNYSPANAGNKALLVADTQGSYYFNFEAANDQVATALPAGMTIQKVYRRLQSSDSDARANIIANLNSGQSVTVYSGHGNVDIWGGAIFSGSDATGLTNGNRLSFVVVMDCLNGYFADPSLKSLAESLLSAPNGGAVASFASSGLTIPDGQHEMGLRMFQLLYGGPSMSIGDASRQAKSATADMDVRRTWILLGDPTLKIR